MVLQEDTDFITRQTNKEMAMSQLCENLDIMKLTAINNGDLKQLYFITMNIEKYCSKKMFTGTKSINQDVFDRNSRV